MSLFRRLFIHSPFKYIISFILAGAMSVGLLFYWGFDQKVYYNDAFFASGALFVAIGGLSFVSYFGAFDIFAYSFSLFNPNRRYKDLYEYSTAKNEKRKSKIVFPFMPYIVVGIVYIIVSLFFIV